MSTGSRTDTFRAASERSAEIWRRLHRDPTGFRVLTGDRTTGALHVGHYFGSLRNRVRLQEMGVDIFLLLADYQAITDRDADDRIADSVADILLDYLAIGIDPARTTMFCHSMVPALNQLLLPFLSVTSVSELQRNPTVKEEIAQSGRSAVSGLMLTYPVHQAADILFCRGNLVPVGKDQLPHIEASRLVAKRMNTLYFGGESYFPEPDALLSEAPLLLGLDGRKMSKSFDNTVNLKSTEDETRALIARAKTDSQRQITYDPENRPEVANLLTLLELCTDRPAEDWAAEIGDDGAKHLKELLTEALNEHLRPIRTRRAQWSSNMDSAWAVLRDGVQRANDIADDTLRTVRSAMGMTYFG